eukprot:TRINITY_DN21561_c0_g1_i1.p1 TRINITY_DN21561_c0_g1~~TRINITY_DN21561_c0_g1_i1.p1  ORF type:complete len:1079 (+),score=269.65 TRINITY_DN21561_c0_g1_i1:62-3298(+)
MLQLQHHLQTRPAQPTAASFDVGTAEEETQRDFGDGIAAGAVASVSSVAVAAVPAALDALEDEGRWEETQFVGDPGTLAPAASSCDRKRPQDLTPAERSDALKQRLTNSTMIKGSLPATTVRRSESNVGVASTVHHGSDAGAVASAGAVVERRPRRDVAVPAALPATATAPAPSPAAVAAAPVAATPAPAGARAAAARAPHAAAAQSPVSAAPLQRRATFPAASPRDVGLRAAAALPLDAPPPVQRRAAPTPTFQLPSAPTAQLAPPARAATAAAATTAQVPAASLPATPASSGRKRALVPAGTSQPPSAKRVSFSTPPEEAAPLNSAHSRLARAHAAAAAEPAMRRARPALSASAPPAAVLSRSFAQAHAGPAHVLSAVRACLEQMSDVDGVSQMLASFPACVLLGGIDARRSFLAALVGEHAHAAEVAETLVSSGLKRPVALEFRSILPESAPSAASQERNSAASDPDALLRDVAEAAARARAGPARSEAFRIRVRCTSCANVDIIDLPERGGYGLAGTPPKLEEMRVEHFGNPSNLLVCLEPGTPLELCRKFDPHLQRTVLVGAAACGGSTRQTEAFGGGPASARLLEERFSSACGCRVPQWLAFLEGLERRLTRQHAEARASVGGEALDDAVVQARGTGLSLSHAFQQVVCGFAGCDVGALTLEEELHRFAQACREGQCGIGDALSASAAEEAASELWACFGSASEYAAYMQTRVRIPGSDVPLSGGAAWQRLLAEVEVALMLSSMPQAELRRLRSAIIQLAGTRARGHQRWDDVTASLMLSVAFEPLRRRVRYVAARVAWALRELRECATAWMASTSAGPLASFQSAPVLAEHCETLRASSIVQELVYSAFDTAVAAVAGQLLRSLEGLLLAGCMNPPLVLQARTQRGLDLPPSSATSAAALAPAPAPAADRAAAPAATAAPSAPAATTAGSRASQRKSGLGLGAAVVSARDRVKLEMERRLLPVQGGMPAQLRDRVCSARDAGAALPHVEAELGLVFNVLSKDLIAMALAGAGTALSALHSRKLYEAMSSLEIGGELKKTFDARQAELESAAARAASRADLAARCLRAVRQA